MPGDSDLLKKAAELLGKRTPQLNADELRHFVQLYLDRREIFIEAADYYGSPLYIIDSRALQSRARNFTATFRKHLPEISVYYAVKSNNHPEIMKRLADEGLGLDVSSGIELNMALETSASDIVFSGPGKTDKELSSAVDNSERVIVLIDSFGELVRLGFMAMQKNKNIRAGVRLTTDERGFWRKFGIPLGDLAHFFDEADKYPHLSLSGLQFHTSWNMNAINQVKFIKRLGEELRTWPESRRQQIKFIDIGGGYWPPQGEWLQPAGTEEGRLMQALSSAAPMPERHHQLPAAPIEHFAEEIGRAVRTELFPFVNCRICLEPGRWICNDAMHILIRVVDKKADDIIITDAGTNAIGWERFETDYFPVINLTHPDLTEHQVYILGSLCTPHDVWGYSYFGEKIEPGDYLLIPTQGAYTYSLRQNFIKPLPGTAII
ncbi:MAG: decarboxylase [candidate division Zixibacteria bacterium HGW-Zixibacteria-1]|nr:MAG: decarboxylase [candidate division Zixibacteria bacterium HGW-Zixibacteria-1]